MSRESSKPPYILSDFFVVRTPLLPAEELERWAAGLAVPEVAGVEAEAFAEAVAADRRRLRLRLEELLERPEIREALWVASPSLSENLDAWRRDPDGKEGLRAERALVRYLTRMASRPTPFGLFSGCSVGGLSEPPGGGANPEGASGEPVARLRLAPRGEYRRHTRFDMDYLFALTEDLGEQPPLRRDLTWYPNSSLYRAAGRWRYAEARLDGKARTYHLVAVESSEYLDATLERARAGARLEPLAEALVASDPEGEITREDADAFLAELVDSQMLVCDLAPRVTGGGALEDLVAVLSSHPAGRPAAQTLERARERLTELDAAGLGNDPERYREIAGLLAEGLPTEVEPSRLFQVDMVKPAGEALLGGAVIEELERGLDLLHRLAGSADSDVLETFRRDFEERWGDRAEVPLTEVLDEEVGIGFGGAGGAAAEASPLMAGLALAPPAPDPTTPWGQRQALLLRLLQETVARGETSLELSAEDLDRLAGEASQPLPDAFHVMATVAAASEEALAAGEFAVHLRGASGPSGARLLGRFCHTDEALHRGVAKHLAAEEALAPDAVFAEIVHLPQGRIGNILARPVLRAWEIPFLGRSAVDPEHRIPVGDLRISVSGGRVRLTSERLGKEVIPRLTTAHNFITRSLAVYRFLCALQGQGVTGGLAWNWGPFEQAPFLPRLTHGRLVLARARWRLTQEEIRELASKEGADLVAAARRLRRQRALPRVVLLADSDNELRVDLDNVLALESFADVIKKRSFATLAEPFPDLGELWVRGSEGRFFHELVTLYERVGETEKEPAKKVGKKAQGAAPVTPAAPTVSTASAAGTAVRLDFPPGSEWLYAKLYCGTATADRVLSEVVGPVARRALASGAADGWFFIRYADPEWHLRVRFHGDPEALGREVLPQLEAAAGDQLEAGQVWKLQLDTYQREASRYGGPAGIAVAERLFWADSEAVLGIVELLEGDEGADARWRLALPGLDTLLTLLGLDLAAKVRVSERLRDGYTREFRANHALKKQIGDRFRKEREALEALMEAAVGGPAAWAAHPLAPGLEALERGARLAEPPAAELRRLDAAGELTQPLESLAPSFAHMHVNRLIRSEARAHELVLYEFLHRLYRGRLGRRKDGLQTS